MNFFLNNEWLALTISIVFQLEYMSNCLANSRLGDLSEKKCTMIATKEEIPTTEPTYEYFVGVCK